MFAEPSVCWLTFVQPGTDDAQFFKLKVNVCWVRPLPTAAGDTDAAKYLVEGEACATGPAPTTPTARANTLSTAIGPDLSRTASRLRMRPSTNEVTVSPL